eukprot:6630726-Prymnesium_polylepis.1
MWIKHTQLCIRRGTHALQRCRQPQQPRHPSCRLCMPDARFDTTDADRPANHATLAQHGCG